ncbi:hypothetical protein H6B10_08740 [Gemmiger formicilis]|uniref:hypothetical protein n=1 Tax=Gemmiger formicilis TaxID=745368 RepID=UPI00195C4001|nr:hypothetical protein [Gemmiger formicilis]MBM6899793.1 hypothetical protein [Gemmiger formicilis]
MSQWNGKRWFRQYRWWLLVFGIMLALVIIPWWTQGIMCNDQVQRRALSMGGPLYFIREIIDMQVHSKGRALSSWLVPAAMYLDFVGKSQVAFRVIPILTILLDMCLFGWLTYKWFANKTLSVFCFLCMLVFLPITWEPTVPQTFINEYNFSVALLILSLAWYQNYLKSGKIRWMVAALAAFFAVCTTYELFVTYTPLFLLIYLIQKGFSRSKELIINVIAFGVVAVLFLLLYKGVNTLFPSEYQGNTFGSLSPKVILPVLFWLFVSAIPGYWLLFNKTTQYLFSSKVLTSVSPLHIGNVVCAILIALLLAILLFGLFRHAKHQMSETRQNQTKGVLGWRNILIVFTALLYMVLPALPLALSTMYQGNVGPGKGFEAVPVTYFLYFASCFLVSFLVYGIVKRLNRIGTRVVISALCVLVLGIQVMNAGIANVQLDDYKHLENIEALLDTNYISDGEPIRTIYSTDAFIKRSVLFIDDGHYINYAFNQGNAVGIHNYEKMPNEMLDSEAVLYVDDYKLFLTNKNYVLVFSPVYINGSDYVICDRNTAQYTEYGQGVKDNNFWIYAFEKGDSGLTVTDINTVDF